jgi:hypothetical protein
MLFNVVQCVVMLLRAPGIFSAIVAILTLMFNTINVSAMEGE